MADKYKVDTERLLSVAEAKKKSAVGWYDSKISNEREKVLEYYNGDKPKRQHSGNSSYVSNDVYDAVEMMRSQLVEVFGGGNDILRFSPQGPEDIQLARDATDLCDFVVYRQNPAEEIFDSVIYDGLMARVGIAKVYWDERADYEDEEFSDVPPEAVDFLTAQEDVDELEADEDPMTGLFKGKLKRKIDKSQVVIEAIAPEEFLIESRAKCIKDASFVTQRILKARADLLQDGYKKEDIERIFKATEAEQLSSVEVLARHSPTEDGVAVDDPGQEEMEKVFLYESYVRGVFKKGYKLPCLFKVVHANGILLEHEEVKRVPFLTFRPLAVPHAFYGNNFAARVIPTQNARTVLTRGILDHTAITTNPRYVVLKGGVTNPREVLDNRLGGMINATRPDAITPLMQAPLNPFVFQSLGMLKDDRAETTGISELSQGLNKDAVSKQNSEGMVEQLVSLSQIRQKHVARRFVYQFLIPLYLEVYQLCLENMKDEKIIPILGDGWKRVDPSVWSERTDVTVSPTLGYGEKERMARKRAEAYSMVSQDPALQEMITPASRHAWITESLKLAMGPEGTTLLIHPSEVKPKEPDPMQMAMLKMQQDEVQAKLISAQAAMLKVQQDRELETMKIQLQELQTMIKQFTATRDAERKDYEVHERIELQREELEQARAVVPENQRGIFSAT